MVACVPALDPDHTGSSPIADPAPNLTVTPTCSLSLIFRDVVCYRRLCLRHVLEQEKKGKRKREAPEVAPLERFEEGELEDAKLMIEEEAQAMRAALGHPLLDPVDDAPVRCPARTSMWLKAAALKPSQTCAPVEG